MLLLPSEIPFLSNTYKMTNIITENRRKYTKKESAIALSSLHTNHLNFKGLLKLKLTFTNVFILGLDKNRFFINTV